MLILAGRQLLDVQSDRLPLTWVEGIAFYADDPPRWLECRGRKGDEYDEDPEDAL